MTSAFFSKSWYLVASLKVRLRTNTQLHRHCYRDHVVYLLEDQLSGNFHRLTPQTYQLLGQMDGEHTLDEVWAWGCEYLGDDMPTQNDLVHVLYNLFKANVLHSNKPPDIETLGQRILKHKRRTLLQKIKSPLGIRIPLWDPEKFLQRSYWFVKPFIGWKGVVLWLFVVACGTLLASRHWEELILNTSDKVLSLNNILWIIVLYPIIKAIHELGHAYMVKRWGGEVHEIGIMFLVFFPVPYVDASAAAGFKNKRSRMLVGAAGILVEVFIASLAMIFWAYAEPGVARAIAYNVMLIAGVSTILFNGNPLLRFDAYYVLSDYLEIPNLGNRANKYFFYLCKRYVWRLPDLQSPSENLKESAWLIGYAVLSYFYRMVIMLVIALYVASTLFFIGALLAVWVVFNSFILPIVKGVGNVMRDHQWQGFRTRTMVIAATGIFSLLTIISFVPVPYTTTASGILSAPEAAAVYTGESGFVAEIYVKHGQTVKQDDVLLRISNKTLETQANKLEAMLREAHSQYQSSLAGVKENPEQVSIAKEIMKFRESEYQRIQEKLKQFDVRAHLSGSISLPNEQLLQGRFLERGELLGHIIKSDTLLALAFIDQDSIEPVRRDVQSVDVRLVSDISNTLNATIVRSTPASSFELPSPVLTVEGGGGIPRDPKATNGLKSFNPYYRLELSLNETPPVLLNQQLYVRITHSPEPLAARWYRSVRRVFLRQLDV